MSTISVIFKGKTLANYQISKGDTLLIGRNKINDIVIENLAVSSQHAKIESDGNGFYYVDLQSENGSFVGDRQIASHWLNDGDMITIGKHMIKFSDPKIIKQYEKNPSSVNKTMKMDTKKYRELLEKNEQAAGRNDLSKKSKVKIQSKSPGILSFLSENKESLELNAKSVKIGKDPQADILAKGLWIGKISAVINKLPDGWYINYVGGISRPRLNNKIVKKPVKLKNLDLISVGSTKLQFLMP